MNEKMHNKTTLILALFTSSVIGGLVSFYFVGGIQLLASDVGVSGAWVVSIFYQSLYAILMAIGFAIFLLIGTKQKILTAKLWPTIFSALTISIANNYYMIHYSGADLPFIGLALLIIASFLIVNTVFTLSFNVFVSPAGHVASQANEKI